ncbi:MAG TPA: FAD-dependent oxidoreductase, partial [Gemmatimonadales bacterium]|nr:FAD-dependent oxidoreductase [Gemmatimonadales bacterium]
MAPAPAFGALVVGAGVHGLAAAWQLARRGVPRVALVERFRLHHDRGSSHGHGRITRSTYSDARYVRLVRVAHAEDWPRLEHESAHRLLHRCDGVFWGPPESELDAWAAAVAAAGADGVERIDPAEARRRFPAFAFPDAHAVLHDTTGGVIAAADTLRALDRLCRIEGVHVLEETRVLGLDPSADPVTVDTDRGR